LFHTTSQEQQHRPFIIANKTGLPVRWSIGSEPPKNLPFEKVNKKRNFWKFLFLFFLLISFSKTNKKKGQNIAFWSPEDANQIERYFLTFYLDDNETVLRHLPIEGARFVCSLAENNFKFSFKFF
jgi:hypothetical protein